jgi:SAM-dependent methyltransferase
LNFLLSAVDYCKNIIFLANGKKPWTYGYDVYKKKQIINSINSKDFNPSTIKEGYGFRLDERIIEYPWLLSRLPSDSGRLLDAGSILNYDFLLAQNSIQTKQIFISTLAPEKFCFWGKGVCYIYEDLRETCYKDDYFDWIVSISTIEHIGLDNTLLYTADESKNENYPNSYLLAIKEFERILKPGGVLYLSFPFGQHKNHGWFQIFNNEMLDEAIQTFSPASFIETHFKYDAQGWRLSSRDESKNATYFDINQTKTYDDDFAAASRAIVCLELMK